MRLREKNVQGLHQMTRRCGMTPDRLFNLIIAVAWRNWKVMENCVMTARRMRLEQQAVEAGFTEQGLRQFLVLLNLDKDTIAAMTLDQFRDFLLYINEANARRYNALCKGVTYG